MTATTHLIMGYCLSQLALPLIKSRGLTPILNSALSLTNTFTHRFPLRLSRAHVRPWMINSVWLLEVAARAGITSSAAAAWPVTRGQMLVITLQAQNWSRFGLGNMSISAHISWWLESGVETFSLSWSLFFNSCLFVTKSGMLTWMVVLLRISLGQQASWAYELVEHSNSHPGQILSQISIINASKLKGLIFQGSSGGGRGANSGLCYLGLATKSTEFGCC